MENDATTPRTARPVVVTVTVVTDPDTVVDSPGLGQPGDVVPLVGILVAALPVKGQREDGVSSGLGVACRV